MKSAEKGRDGWDVLITINYDALDPIASVVDSLNGTNSFGYDAVRGASE